MVKYILYWIIYLHTHQHIQFLNATYNANMNTYYIIPIEREYFTILQLAQHTLI